jgi:hypothetical protein
MLLNAILGSLAAENTFMDGDTCNCTDEEFIFILGG